MSDLKLLPMMPHTAAKHLLLKLYLDRWYPVLGRYNRRINYIDGFAGPGVYQGGEMGSPIIAVESAMAHVQRGTLASNVTVNFVFVERNPKFASHLRTQVSRLNPPNQFRIAVLDGEFSDQIGGILDKFEQDSKIFAPTFAFVDPFGFSGMPLNLMARILKHPKCEVFINVMVEFINRFLEHPNDSVVAHFPRTFGTEEVLEIPKCSGKRVDQILGLYRCQLTKYARFVGRFDMYGKKDRKTYSLFFASNAAKGFEKMKEAMWKVDKVSGSQFSDAFAEYTTLFRAMGIECLWDQLLDEFRRETVWMSEIERYVIERTDYLPSHVRKILREREAKGDISVISARGYKRRKGTFQRNKVRISFP